MNNVAITDVLQFTHCVANPAGVRAINVIREGVNFALIAMCIARRWFRTWSGKEHGNGKGGDVKRGRREFGGVRSIAPERDRVTFQAGAVPHSGHLAGVARRS